MKLTWHCGNGGKAGKRLPFPLNTKGERGIASVYIYICVCVCV